MTDLTTTASTLSDRLASIVGDRVHAASEPGFDAALTLYGGAPRVPALIVQPRDASEVSRILPLVAEAGLPVTVRAGGHSLARRSRVEGGVVLDLSLLDTVDIDPDAQVATVGGGVTAGNYTSIAAEHGLATGFGDTASVGVGGLTLGGGIGFLSRRLGLAIDQLVGAELVTADGRILDVNESSEPDLFWALRGGSAGLGVVTAFRFRLAEISNVTGGILVFESDAELVAALVAYVADAPDELSAMINVMNAPPAPFVPEHLHGRPAVLLFAAHSGSQDDAAAVFDEIRALGRVVADTVNLVPYSSMLSNVALPPGVVPVPVSRSGFADALTAERVAAGITALADLQNPIALINIRPMRGAIARVAPDATAFAHRDRTAMVWVTAIYMDQDAAAAHEAEVAELTAALTDGDSGYVNFFSDVPDVEARAYPEATLARLRAIRSAVDPMGVFAR
jgi:FAD/FMN-containing dehydrogenase